MEVCWFNSNPTQPCPQIEIVSFRVEDATKTVPNPKVGFVLRGAKTASAAKALLQLDNEEGLCPFGPSSDNNKTKGQRNLNFFTKDPEEWHEGARFVHTFDVNEEGLYDLEFFNCRKGSHVNFEVGSIMRWVFLLLLQKKSH